MNQPTKSAFENTRIDWNIILKERERRNLQPPEPKAGRSTAKFGL
jgi:hypothetical protein